MPQTRRAGGPPTVVPQAHSRYNQTAMASNPVRFGTSGWRGLVAEDFTFPNVRLAAAGIAYYLLAQSGRPRASVGHDTRFLSEKFADAAAEILNSHGIETFVATRPDPTPALAQEIISQKLNGGINITASHNPAEYNGVKFSTADGAPALPEATRQIEAFITKIQADEYSLKGPQWAAPLRHAAEPRATYLAAIRPKVELKTIAAAKLRIAYDPLYGTGRGYLDDLLREAGVEVHTLHNHRDPMFSGAGPEPSPANLRELSQFVKDNGCALGLATDGDADRFGMVDRDGAWIEANDILALLSDYLIEVRQIPGGLGRSVATTHLIDRVANYHKRPVYQTPVGFKYLGELIKEDKAVLVGEESAGLSIRGHLPEKDGILACLLVAEMTAKRGGASLGEQLRTLHQKVGPCYTVRVNERLTPEAQKKLIAKLKQDIGQFDGRKVSKLDRTDGLKMIFDGGAWVLMRPSGTEPVVRVYCEAPSRPELDALVAAARKFVANP